MFGPPTRVLVGHADYDMAALLGFVKPQLGHLTAALQIDPGAVDSSVKHPGSNASISASRLWLPAHRPILTRLRARFPPPR